MREKAYVLRYVLLGQTIVWIKKVKDIKPLNFFHKHNAIAEAWQYT